MKKTRDAAMALIQDRNDDERRSNMNAKNR
jgi:hypothetical protein